MEFGYEFSSSQNELIKQLADKMRFVGYFLIGVGVLTAIGGLFALRNGGVGSIISGVVQVIIGVWTSKAASAFKLIVETQGNDIENLMGALGELRKLYALQRSSPGFPHLVTSERERERCSGGGGMAGQRRYISQSKLLVDVSREW